MQFRPQKGPQEFFLTSPADIVIYGGAAGGGKSYALLLEGLRHMENPGYEGVIFRQSYPMLINPGGLWSEANKIYSHFNATPRLTDLSWTFKSGAKMRFSYLDHDTDVNKWQGSQICFLAFDELTHFSKHQFFYMLSRNRSLCGARPYVRATCNPDPDSWVREFISWWIGEDGLPIKSRCGRIRLFVRRGDKLFFGDTEEELSKQVSDYSPNESKSLTFISANLHDNAVLMKADPGYVANLKALPRVQREALLHGNWNVRATAGNFFRREWFHVCDALPAGLQFVRYWDRAATAKTESNNPDFTAGVKMAKDNEGRLFITDLRHFQGSPLEVVTAIKVMASQDGHACKIGLEQEPGSSGKFEVSYFIRSLLGYIVRPYPATKDKVTRAGPFSSQVQAGNVWVLRAAWNEEFFSEMENFPEDKHDDIVDAASGAFSMIADSGGDYSNL